MSELEGTLDTIQPSAHVFQRKKQAVKEDHWYQYRASPLGPPSLGLILLLYEFSMAAVTNDHKLMIENNRNLLFDSSGV